MRKTKLLCLFSFIMLLSCTEPIDVDQLKSVCLPNDPQCANEDFDGDGVINGEDDFPSDVRCAQRDNDNCSACGFGCGDAERCNLEVGACEAKETELCDTIDNDGDGQVDEEVEALAPLASNQDGVCAGRKQICVAGEFVDPPFTGVEGYEANETVCDGIDSDCDGTVDENLTAPLANIQEGVCVGARKVCEGVRGWQEPNYSESSGRRASEQACDGIDEDCDGTSDEGLTAPLAPNQQGVCAGSSQVCAGEQGWQDPQLNSLEGYEANETVCDGIDSDCDGTVDENLTAPLANIQEGVCVGARKVCEGVRGWQDPNYSEINDFEASESSCDGIDSDCDGSIDENLVGPLANRQEGVCAGSLKRCEGVRGWAEPDYSQRQGYEVSESVCDGVDSDCDGNVDESLAPPLANLQNGVCQGARQVCGGAQGWTEPNYTQSHGKQEQELVCDGIDEDCDGLADEGLSGPLASNQVGVCAGAQQVCDGQGGWQDPDLNTINGYSANELRCDGIDEDCDGQVDEDLTPPLASLQAGVCAELRQVCGPNGFADPDYSQSADFEASESRCDGLDNDCDGQIDEGLQGPLADRQVGVCSGTRKACGGVRGWVEPDYAQTTPGYEAEESLCDTVDSDCDGLVDERLFGPLADKQSGVCEGSKKVCLNGEYIEPNYQQLADYEVNESTCDGIDSDCDGTVDENLTLPAADFQEGVCASFSKDCVNGELLEPDYTSENLYEVQELSCDNEDNDCDGQADEGLEFYQVFCGVGACTRVGLGQCQQGIYSDNCIPGNPAPSDDCDGVDNDCDERLDEDGPLADIQIGVCQSSQRICDVNSGNWIEPDYTTLPNAQANESLCDGLDNDCDGNTDEALVGALAPLALRQQGVCQGVHQVCISGQFIEPAYVNQAPQYEASESACDGLDNDCDGKIDEALSAPLSDLQLGVCAQSVKVCNGQAGWLEPNYELSLANYELTELSCDGLDNDCDGSVDEAISGARAPLATRQVGVCEGARKTCVAGQFIEPAYAGISGYEANETLCDGLDNDCDGSVDEALIPPLADVQVGVCANSLKFCGGGQGWLNPDYATNLPAYEQEETRCDGLDNDCDGISDEGISGELAPLSAIQVGVCAGVRRECVDGAFIEPDYADKRDTYLNEDTLCDGLDNDCDGVIDESVATFAPLTSKQNGVCAGLRQVCAGGQGWLDLDYSTVNNFEGLELTCDGLDNDCDGTVDEALIPPLADIQLGVCEAQIKLCGGVRGWEEPDYSLVETYESAEATCDGLDNDCDGAVDEALTAPLADRQLGICNSVRKAACGGVDGWLEPDYAALLDDFMQEDVACDGQDNDCDGITDEGGGDGTCGVGACLRVNEVSCVDGLRVDICIPGEPTDEITLDSIDNDCDGLIDEPYMEVCNDLVDNDLDGTIDEVVGEFCGDGIDNDCDGFIDEWRVSTYSNDEDLLYHLVSLGFYECIDNAQLWYNKLTKFGKIVPKEIYCNDNNVLIGDQANRTDYIYNPESLKMYSYNAEYINSLRNEENRTIRPRAITRSNNSDLVVLNQVNYDDFSSHQLMFFNSELSIDWSLSMRRAVSGDMPGYQMLTTDNQDNVYLGLSNDGWVVNDLNPRPEPLTLMKFSNDGVYQWHINLDGFSRWRVMKLTKIKVINDYLYVVGDSYSFLGFPNYGQLDIMIAKFDLDGNLDWLNLIVDEFQSQIVDVEFTADGESYIVNQIVNILYKIDTDGNVAFQKSLDPQTRISDVKLTDDDLITMWGRTLDGNNSRVYHPTGNINLCDLPVQR